MLHTATDKAQTELWALLCGNSVLPNLLSKTTIDSCASPINSRLLDDANAVHSVELDSVLQLTVIRNHSKHKVRSLQPTTSYLTLS